METDDQIASIHAAAHIAGDHESQTPRTLAPQLRRCGPPTRAGRAPRAIHRRPIGLPRLVHRWTFRESRECGIQMIPGETTRRPDYRLRRVTSRIIETSGTDDEKVRHAGVARVNR